MPYVTPSKQFVINCNSNEAYRMLLWLQNYIVYKLKKKINKESKNKHIFNLKLSNLDAKKKIMDKFSFAIEIWIVNLVSKWKYCHLHNALLLDLDTDFHLNPRITSHHTDRHHNFFVFGYCPIFLDKINELQMLTFNKIHTEKNIKRYKIVWRWWNQ